MFFEKWWNGQYNFCSDSRHPSKKSPQANLLFSTTGNSPYLLMLFWKPCSHSLRTTYYLLIYGAVA